MKKYLFVLMSAVMLVCTSCHKEKTYTFINDFQSQSCELKVQLMEYDGGGSQSNSNIINNAVVGTKKAFTANEKSEKVVCMLKMTTNGNSITRYISNVFYLEEGKNVEIKLEDNTLVSSQNPI